MASAGGGPGVERVDSVPVAPVGTSSGIGRGRAARPAARIPDVEPPVAVEAWDEVGPLERIPLRASGSTRQDMPARVIAVALALFVGAAVWKPWSLVAGPAPTPSPSAPAAVAPRSAPATPVPPSLARPGPIGGLDLSFMGVADLHPTWGVAVAYVSRAEIVAATQSGRRIAPLVAWVPAVTAIRAQGLPLNHPDTVAIAVAVTWPNASRPIGIQLMDRGTLPSMQGGSGRGRSPGEVPLSSPLPRLLQEAYPGAEWAAEQQEVDWQLVSGTFFLPPQDLPADVAGWLTSGWSPGTYQFVIRGPDGSIAAFPFRIRA